MEKVIKNWKIKLWKLPKLSKNSQNRLINSAKKEKNIEKLIQSKKETLSTDDLTENEKTITSTVNDDPKEKIDQHKDNNINVKLTIKSKPDVLDDMPSKPRKLKKISIDDIADNDKSNFLSIAGENH